MVAVSGEQWQALSQEGWTFKDEGKAAISEELQKGDLGNLRQAALNFDLRKAGASALPDDVNRASQASIQGPLVLQVVSVDDISKPSRASAESGSSSGRMLRLKLTDGAITATCIEFQPIPSISAAVAPGTKAVLKGKVQVRGGVVLLEPKSITLLGGRVEALAEAWEIQRKYGGLDRARPSAAADAGEVPPPFKHFQPGHKSKVPRPDPATSSNKAVAASAPTSTHPAENSKDGLPPGLGPPPGLKQQQQQRGAPDEGGRRQTAARGRGGRAQGGRGGGAQAEEVPGAGRGRGRKGEDARGGRGSRGRGGGGGGGSAQLHAGDEAASADGPPRRPPASTAQLPEHEQALGKGPKPQASKLLGKLSAGEQQRREELEERRQRRVQHRMRRRGYGDDGGADDGSMTLEEYEARKARPPAVAPAAATTALTQEQKDEQLARELQRQMDLEEAEQQVPAGAAGGGLAGDLLSSLFSYDRQAPEETGRGRGRGRGRGGRRGRGRGRY